MRRETIPPEFDKDEAVIKKRDVLDSLTIAINEGKKELEDIETEKKGKIKELATCVKRFNDNDELVKERITSLQEKKEEAKEKLNKINEKISEKEEERDDLQERVDTLGAYFKEKKAQIDEEVSVYEKEAKKDGKALAKSILEQQETLKNLSDNNNSLKDENNNLIANINNNRGIVSKAEKTLEQAEKKEKDISFLIERKTKDIILISEELSEKESELTSIEKEINSKRGVLGGINREIDNKQAELNALSKERSDFERDKLIFSEQKTLILAKEQFVKEKYELAGLKYD